MWPYSGRDCLICGHNLAVTVLQVAIIWPWLSYMRLSSCMCHIGWRVYPSPISPLSSSSSPSLPWPPMARRANSDRLETFQGLLPERHGHNLTVTVLKVAIIQMWLSYMWLSYRCLACATLGWGCTPPPYLRCPPPPRHCLRLARPRPPSPSSCHACTGVRSFSCHACTGVGRKSIGYTTILITDEDFLRGLLFYQDFGCSHTLNVLKERRRRCEHPHLRLGLYLITIQKFACGLCWGRRRRRRLRALSARPPQQSYRT